MCRTRTRRVCSTARSTRVRRLRRHGVPAVLVGGDHAAHPRLAPQGSAGAHLVEAAQAARRAGVSPEESELLAEFKAEPERVNLNAELA